ncbi:hypothetical protein Ae168Ps1_0689c [Pseudonocardia sp. Ae168_Ps1]|nr:hypothetical protein Ae168Ps1_0689c [Pseudonocardia sp. Ae168_Ps1]
MSRNSHRHRLVGGGSAMNSSSPWTGARRHAVRREESASDTGVPATGHLRRHGHRRRRSRCSSGLTAAWSVAGATV